MVSKNTIFLWYDGAALEAARLGLNGGPKIKHNEAFSFQIATDDQAETDRDPAAAKRAFEAMMPMRKIDIAAIEAARRGH